MSRWPSPNENGVFSKDEAEVFRYEDNYLWVQGHVLQVSENEWLSAASFSIKVSSNNSGTMGCHSPLKASKYNQVVGSREEAVQRIRRIVGGYAENGKHEKQSKLAVRSWDAVSIWAFNIDKQLELFA